jgi:hypothetical protein
LLKVWQPQERLGVEVKTAEQVKTELQSVVSAFFAEVEKLMDKGQSFQLAVINICKGRPDLVEQESSLRDHLKALGSIEQSLSASDLRAWAERQQEGALSCAAVSRLAGGAVRRLPIAQLGVRYRGKQKVEITRAMLAEVVANFRKRDTGEVPIDYDHGIELAAGAGAPVPAAGWIKSIDDAPDGQGILWGSVVWTSKAERMIQAGEYKYVSPVIDPGVRDNKTGDAQGWTLTSAALTNQPVLQGMPALVLSEAGQVAGVGNERGVSNNEWDGIQVEINQKVKEVMAAKGIDYSKAFQALMLDDRSLWRRYQAAQTRELGRRDSGPANAVYEEICPLVSAKIAASEGGGMDYAAALKMVLQERPDIERRYKDAIR